MSGDNTRSLSRRQLIKAAALSGAAGMAAGRIASAAEISPSVNTTMQAHGSFRLFDPEGLPPSVGFSQVAEIQRGKLIYVSGQVPRNAAGDLVGPNDFKAQLEQVFANLDASLRGTGATFADVVKLNYYCVASIEPAQQRHIVEVRDRYVNKRSPPASTFVFVSRLVRPEWLIEIEAMAVLPSQSEPVVVLAQIEIDPQDMTAATTLARALAASTVKEDGCLHYAFGVDVDGGNRLLLSELWRDQAALDAHLGTRWLREFRTALRKLRVRKSVVKRYAVNRATDLVMPALD